MDAATVAAVAAATGVHESSIYRRWRTRENLIHEAVDSITDDAVNVPDTGDAEQDLRLFGRSVLRFLTTPVGESLLRLSTLSRIQEEAGRLSTFWEDRLGQAKAIVDRGIERGELRPDCDPDLLIQMINGTLVAKMVIFQHPLEDDLADRLVDQVLIGARSGGEGTVLHDAPHRVTNH